MIARFADAIRDPLVLKLYLAAGLGLLVLPMAALALWYHVRAGGTEGGRKLMEQQRRSNARGLAPQGTVRMARDISSGRYGEETRRLQHRTYGFVIAWLLANVIVFGALIWAQDLNKRRDAAAGQTVAPRR